MNDITIWDDIAKTYDEHTYLEKEGSYPANRYRADRVIEFLKTLPVGKALDAGGGTGYVAARVAELDWQVSYLDASKEMLEVARSKTDNRLADYCQGSITSMDQYADRSFDVVMMNGVLPYLSTDEEPAAYHEVQRILKDDGHFIAAHYNQFFDLLEMDAFTAQTLADITETSDRDLMTNRLAKLVPSVNIPETRSMKVENPLTYERKLQQFGFTEIKRHYYNFHILPPVLETTDDNNLRARIEETYHGEWQGVILARAFFVIAKKG